MRREPALAGGASRPWRAGRAGRRGSCAGNTPH